MEPKTTSTEPVSRVRSSMRRSVSEATSEASVETISPEEAEVIGEVPVDATAELDTVDETPVAPVSRVRNSMGRGTSTVGVSESRPSRVVSRMIRTEKSGEVTSPEPSGPSLLEGTSMTGEGSPEALLTKLSRSTLVESAKRIGFSSAFGGSQQGGLDSNNLKPRALFTNRYRRANHDGKVIPGKNGFSQAWETGSEVADLVVERPFDRHKFYL